MGPLWESRTIRKPCSRPLPILAALLCAAWPPAAAQTTATIDIDTTATLPIQPGFSGVSDDLFVPVEYWDYRFNTIASQVGYGWIRFPGGNSSDIYNWRTGEQMADWLAQFGANPPNGDEASVAEVAGRGGAKLIDAANRAGFLTSSLIICANGFTDTAQSIGQLAAYVKANNIPVAAWELSNEPYLYPEFFAGATDYLNKMKPYRDAIKAVDPNAIIAVFARDPGNTAAINAWDAALAAYADKYWDAITYHHYPSQSTGTFDKWMADESAVLAKNTSAVIGQLAPVGPSGVKFLITEFDPTLPNDQKTGTISITNGTIWGGIYAAEYTMRMSTAPSVLYVGPNEIVRNAGVYPTASHEADVTAAANAGKTIDTLSLDFGFFLSAQAAGQAVLNGVINQAVQSNKTTVTGGATVPATGMSPIPALYAMSYSNAVGGLSVVITNKSATPHRVTIRVNGAAAAGPFPLQFISAADPSTANTVANPSAVTIQTDSSANPVTVPPYSVLRADVIVPPVATIVNSASYRSGAVAPLELIVARGPGFAPDSVGAAEPLPLTLDGTSVVITDSKGAAKMAPMYYVTPRQASFVIPAGVAPGAATAKVMRNGATVLTANFSIGPVSPGLYSANSNGAGVAAATAFRIDQNNAITPLPVFACQDGVPLSCLSSPLSLGAATDTVFVTLYGTGIRGAAKVQAYVAGQSVPIQYAGAQPTHQGLDQVNISIPHSVAGTGEASVYVVADGAVSNMVTINIQ